MEPDQFLERVIEVAEETASPDGSGWWLSFTDADLPAGTQFLGACFVLAPNLPAAITLTHVLGINPGGGIQMLGPIPPDLAAQVPARFVDVLMDRETCAEFDRVMEEVAPL